jgi:protein TonB
VKRLAQFCAPSYDTVQNDYLIYLLLAPRLNDKMELTSPQQLFQINPNMRHRFPVERVVGLSLVLALHAAVLYGLWNAQLIPSPVDAATMFVNFIAPAEVKKTYEPKRAPAPKPRPIEPLPQTRQLVSETPATAPTDYVAPPPPTKPEPIQATVAAPPIIQAPLPVGPVALASELSVACPKRSAPTYPAMSHRLGETGVVMLRVELSESGQVVNARIQSSSGFDRLDDAALVAVRTWHCNPATRNGQAVRSTALQPFNFVLQGN